MFCNIINKVRVLIGTKRPLWGRTYNHNDLTSIGLERRLIRSSPPDSVLISKVTQLNTVACQNGHVKVTEVYIH